MVGGRAASAAAIAVAMGLRVPGVDAVGATRVEARGPAPAGVGALIGGRADREVTRRMGPSLGAAKAPPKEEPAATVPKAAPGRLFQAVPAPSTPFEVADHRARPATEAHLT